MNRWIRWAMPGLLLAAVSGCAVSALSPDTATQDDVVDHAAVSPTARRDLARATGLLLSTPAPEPLWEPFLLPGKRYVPFKPHREAGRATLRVDARQSVSILRQRFAAPGLNRLGQLRFSWRADALPDGADLSDAALEDAPVRIMLAFDGDRRRLGPRAHRMSELSRLLTGEELPFATLVYLWSRSDALESVIHHPRTDRIRKLVVERGDDNLGRWLEYTRNVRADFVRAFGEEPGPLRVIALMTDTDNTQSELSAWYGPLKLEHEPGSTAR